MTGSWRSRIEAPAPIGQKAQPATAGGSCLQAKAMNTRPAGSRWRAHTLRSRSLHRPFWQAASGSPQQRSQHPDIGFPDDIPPGRARCIRGIRGLFANAFLEDCRLQSRVEHAAAPCRFQRCSGGPQGAERPCDGDRKGRLYLLSSPSLQPEVHG